jgi:hypothetical protein
MAGEWTTMFGGGSGGGNSPVTLSVVQVGSEVSGTYRPTPGGPPSMPGAISGTFAGGVLDGTWRDTSGASGTMRLTLSADGASFTGTWASSSLSGAWNGVRSSAAPSPAGSSMAAEPAEEAAEAPANDGSPAGYPDVRGTYSSQFEASGRMLPFTVVLVQNLDARSAQRVAVFREGDCVASPGRCVAGFYSYADGSGTGTVIGVFPESGGNELYGTWSDRAGTGGLRFSFAATPRGTMTFDGGWYNAPLGRARSRRVGAWRGLRTRR